MNQVLKYITGLTKSFKFAINGLMIFIKEEKKFLVHVCAAIIAISLAFIYNLTSIEFILLIIAIGTVLVSEIFNTAIECLSNRITLENDSQIKKVKDLSAAGVLISAIIALILGMIIFLPKIANYE